MNCFSWNSGGLKVFPIWRFNVIFFFFITDVTDPVGDVLAFIRKFKEEYGQNHPVFYQGAYSQVG